MNFLAATNAKPVRNMDAEMQSLQEAQEKRSVIVSNREARQERIATKVAASSAKSDQAPDCSTHPDAPHGFNRNASHSLDRYVCDCEGWKPDEL